MKDAKYLYKVWIEDIGYYVRPSGHPFHKTREEADEVAFRWHGVVHLFKITKENL